MMIGMTIGSSKCVMADIDPGIDGRRPNSQAVQYTSPTMSSCCMKKLTRIACTPEKKRCLLTSKRTKASASIAMGHKRLTN
ncbi:hypothetical protein P3T21_005607 [Paraburkholderia sp. GAS334]